MTGQLAIARKIQDLIDSTIEKTKATERESVLQALSNALEETEKLFDSLQKVSYLNDIANSYAALGSTEKCIEVLSQALEDTQGIEYDSNKASELSKIGSTYIKLGLAEQGFDLLDQALQIAKSSKDIGEFYEIDFAFCDLAYAYGEAGRNDVALEIASLIEDEFRVVLRVFSSLAQEYVRLGQYDQVIRFIQAARTTHYEMFVVGMVIKACLAVGDYDHVLQFIEMLDNPTDKISALTDLAEAHLKAGHQEKAWELLDQACAIPETAAD